MTDKGTRSRVLSSSANSKELKPFTTAQDQVNDNLNSSIDEKSLNKKTKTETENVILLFPNSSYSPEASVFSIDHILEFILAQLDQKTLLNCHLVSRSWMYFSSNALQKILKSIEFVHCNICLGGGSKQQVLLHNGDDKIKDHSITHLIDVMNNSTNFPCNSFSFDNYISGRIDLDSLAPGFFAHGLSLKKLRFAGCLLLTDLKQLLLTQAPNLEQLELNHVEFKYQEFESGAPYKPETDKGRRRRESLFSEGRKPVLKNLKAIILLTSNIPDIFMEQLLECSPNLVEINVNQDGDCFPYYLFEPVNRLHLLKKLVVNIKENMIGSLEMAGNSPQNNWAVQDIRLLSNNSINWLTEFDLCLRGAEALNKILMGCSATCENLKWDCWFQDFNIPVVMPGVKHFSYHFSSDPKFPEIIFPTGMSLLDTFPNLTTLELKTSTWKVLENFPIKNLFGNDNDRDPLPLPNVSNVSLEFHAAPNLLERFRGIFPNAVIQTKELRR